MDIYICADSDFAVWWFGDFGFSGPWGLAPGPGSSRKLEEIDAWGLGGGDLMAGSGCRSLGGGDRSLGGGDRSLGGGDPVPHGGDLMLGGGDRSLEIGDRDLRSGAEI